MWEEQCTRIKYKKSFTIRVDACVALKLYLCNMTLIYVCKKLCVFKNNTMYVCMMKGFVVYQQPFH